jgi:hypothetical protein
VRLKLMPESLPGVDDIAILAADPLALQVSGLLQLGHDTLDGSLRDAHRYGHFSQWLLRIACQTDQHMGMIRKKIPLV